MPCAAFEARSWGLASAPRQRDGCADRVIGLTPRDESVVMEKIEEQTLRRETFTA